MKKVLSLVMVIVLGLVLMACQSRALGDDVLVVGLEVDYAPFNWAETKQTETNWPVDGQSNMYAEGYDVQIAKRLAQRLGRKLVIKQIVWDSLIEAVTAGEIHVIIAGMSPTAARREIIDFTDLYYRTNHVVVVKSNSTYAAATTLEDLRGANGVGQRGTVYADLVDFVVESHGAVALPVIDTVPLISSALVGGTADFTIVEKPVALGMIAAHSSLSIILDVEENIFEVSEEDTALAIGISKQNTSLRDEINTILASITQTDRDQMMSDAVARQGA